MKQLTIWICDFCDTSSQDKKYMKEHETNCKYNPINKRCHSCSNFFQPLFNIGALACKLKGKNPYYYENSGEICKFWEPKNITILRQLKIKKIINET